jgi:hypothetical protein
MKNFDPFDEEQRENLRQLFSKTYSVSEAKDAVIKCGGNADIEP